MGNISWTDNLVSGDNVTATHITNMKTDITTVVNGNIANSNISASAAIVESKLAFNTTTGHHHDGSDSRIISTGGQRGFLQGGIMEYVAADQIRVQSGVIEIGGILYERTSYSTTIDTDTAGHWVEGSSQRGVSKWAYIYGYNDSGTTWDVKYWLQPPQYANAGADNSGSLIFRSTGGVWYRCLGAVRLDAVGSGNILNFYQRNNKIMYDTPVSITTTVSAGAWSVATSCATAIPAISTFGIFGLASADTAGIGVSAIWIRPNGSTWGTNTANGISAKVDDVGGQRICATDSSQQIQYYNSAAADSTEVSVEGYYLDIR